MRQFADFVEEQGAAVGFYELADLFVAGAGEGAFLVTEQDRLHERLRDRAAIYGDEGLAGAVAAAADRAREQFLAGARLALEQHRNVGGGRFLGELERRLHARALRREVFEAERAVGGPAQTPHLAREHGLRQRIAQRYLQALGARGLHDEVDRARAHGRDHGVDRAVRGLHDHRRIDAALLEPAEQSHAVEVGHDEVENDAADSGAVLALEQAPRRLAALGEHRLVAEAADHGVQEPALDRIVVGYENTRGHFPSRPYRSGTIWAECVNGS